MRRKNIPNVLEKLNSSHPILRFTVNDFPNGNDKLHFLDLLIDNNYTDIFYKVTHTGQYTHFASYIPWALRTAWIKSLFHCDKKICSNNHLFNNQLSFIKKRM